MPNSNNLGAIGGLFGKVGGPFADCLSRMAAYTTNSLCPILIPSPAEIAETIVRGNMNVRQATPLWLMNGIVPPLDFAKINPFKVDEQKRYDLAKGYDEEVTPHLAVLMNRVAMPTVGDLLDALNRNIVTEEFVDYCLIRQTYINGAVRNTIKSLRHYIPGVSDIIRMAVREAFNEEQVRLLGLDEEYDQNPDYVFWAARQGLGEVSLPDGRGGQRSYDFAKGYWRAHWHLPAPGQAYDMLHRLRPDRVQRYKVGNVVPQPFGIDELNSLLKANDYAPKWRIPLAAIAYRIPGRIDIRRMLKFGVIEKEDAVSMFMDLGYVQEDAEALAELEERQLQRTRESAIVTLTKSIIKKGLLYGAINENQARDYLRDYGLPLEQQFRTVAHMKAEMAVERVERSVRAVRSKYISGAVNTENALQQLRVIGVSNERGSELVDEWRWAIEGGRKQISAEKALEFYKKGLLDESNLASRLINLGYSDTNVRLLISNAKLEIAEALSKATAKREAQEAKARKETQRLIKQAQSEEQQRREKAQKALERQIREMERQRKEAQTALAKHGSPAQLAKWVKKCLISREEALARLQVLGWPTEDAGRLLAQEEGSQCPEGETQNTAPES